jgi:hypothetical protein
MTPPRTSAVLALRVVLFLALSGLGTWGILTGVPIRQLSEAQVDLIGIFRIIYGLLFALRLYRGLPAVSLVWGWQNAGQVRRYYWMNILNCCCLAAGFLTPIALVAHWAFLVFVQRHHRAYSVEDVLNRLPGFCLFFMNSHLGFSLDRILGWNFGLTEGGAVGVNFFIWTFSAIMFSTGYEKIWSPVWRKGLGFYHFVSLPFIARPIFRKLRNFRSICLLASWTSLFLELGLILTVFHRMIFMATLVVLVGFGLTLTFGPAPFFFVGGATTWAASFTLAMAVTAQQLPLYAPGWGGYLLIALYCAGCFSIMNFAPIRGGWLANLMLHTVHMRPYILFNEVHFYGLYIFRVLGRFGREQVDCLELFKENGEPGPMQEIRPVGLYAAFTRVTDYCIAQIHQQGDRLEFYGRVLADMGWAAIDRMKRAGRGMPEDLIFEVRVYDPEEGYDVLTSPWRTDWVQIGRYAFSHSEIQFIQEGEIPHYGKTVRWPVRWK